MTIPPVSSYKHDSGLGDVVGGPQLSLLRFKSVASSLRHLGMFESPPTATKLVEESFELDAQLGARAPLALTLPPASHCAPREAGTPVPRALPPPPRVRAAHAVVDEAHLSPVP